MISLKGTRRGALATLAVLAAGVLTATPANADAGVVIDVSVGIAPPVLPVYEQPPLPGPGYLWVPGYWAWGDAGYFWVPGYWSQPPQVGLLWTPGWWGWGGGHYLFHGGYWGPHVGFYGGINYGFGYGGIGFAGGEWRGGGFFYNSAVVNVGGAHITNVYENRTIVNQTTIINNNHYAFNGPGGINRTPAASEQQAMNEHHFEPTEQQQQHQHFAAQDRAQLASVNHGQPATAAAANPGAYRQVAQQHAHAQPISAQDRQAGAHYSPAVARSGGQNPSGGNNLNRPTHQPNGERPAEAQRPAPEARSAPEARPAPRPAPAPHPAPTARPAPRPAPRPTGHPAPAPHGGGRGHGHR